MRLSRLRVERSSFAARAKAAEISEKLKGRPSFIITTASPGHIGSAATLRGQFATDMHILIRHRRRPHSAIAWQTCLIGGYTIIYLCFGSHS